MTLDIRIEDTFNSPFIGEWDLPEDGSDLRLTIKDVERETIKNRKTNTESIQVVLYFEEDYKPMVLSARINKDNIKQATGTGRTSKWVGKQIQLFREPGTWFGKSGYAVRIRPYVSE